MRGSSEPRPRSRSGGSRLELGGAPGFVTVDSQAEDTTLSLDSLYTTWLHTVDERLDLLVSYGRGLQ